MPAFLALVQVVASRVSIEDWLVEDSPFDLDRESAKQYTAPLFSAFPDVHVTIEDMVAEGDRVVTRWTARGTHQGELMGIAPTGKTIAVMGISIGRHDANGQLLESWTSWDRLSMLQQLEINLVPERARKVRSRYGCEGVASGRRMMTNF